MTRIMTNPELIKPGRKPSLPDKLWFCRSVEQMIPMASEVWVSDVLRDGTVIDRIMIQSRPINSADLLVMGASVTLISSKNPTPAEAIAADDVMRWQELGGVWSWRAYGSECNETWELQKIVRGSDLRLAITVMNRTVGNADVRVGVRYEA